jgi:hypothetical protein
VQGLVRSILKEKITNVVTRLTEAHEQVLKQVEEDFLEEQKKDLIAAQSDSEEN